MRAARSERSLVAQTVSGFHGDPSIGYSPEQSLLAQARCAALIELPIHLVTQTHHDFVFARVAIDQTFQETRLV